MHFHNETFLQSQHQPNEKEAEVLADLTIDETAVITAYKLSTEENANSTAKRLFELGLIIGEKLTVIHKSPFGGNPMAVSILGSTIGLNEEEANLIVIERV